MSHDMFTCKKSGANIMRNDIIADDADENKGFSFSYNF